MIKRNDNAYATWNFDSSNLLSNLILAAFRDHQAGCLINSNAWMPFATSGLGGQATCARSSLGAGCDSFYYKKGTAHPPGCTLSGNRGQVG